jgi:hypothetical protein
MRLKILISTLLIFSGSLQAATPALKGIPVKDLIKPTLLKPDFLQPLLSCNNGNIAEVEIEALSDTSYKMKLNFKGLMLKESGSGEDHLSCSLYSRLPTDLGAAAQVMSIVSSRYAIETDTPRPIEGDAQFGVGVVDAEGLNFEGDHYLVPGVAAGLEGQSQRKSSSSPRTLMMKSRPAPASVVRTEASKKRIKLIPLPPKIINIADLIIKLPRPLIMKTTRVGFGHTSFSSNEPQTIDVDFGSRQPTVQEGQYIVNQFSFSLRGDKGNKDARVELNWLEVILESQNL